MCALPFIYTVIIFSLLLSLAVICLSIASAVLFTIISSKINSYIEKKEIQKILKNINDFNSLTSGTQKTLIFSNGLNLFQGFLIEDSFISINSILKKNNNNLIIEIDVNDLFKSPEQSIYFNFLDIIFAKCIDLIYKTFNVNLNLEINNNSIGTVTKWLGNLKGTVNIALKDNKISVNNQSLEKNLCKNSQLKEENLKNQEIKFFEKKIKFLEKISKLSGKNPQFKFQANLNKLNDHNKELLEEKKQILHKSGIIIEFIENDLKKNQDLNNKTEETGNLQDLNNKTEEPADQSTTQEEAADQIISGGKTVINGVKKIANGAKETFYLCLYRVLTGEDFNTNTPN